MSARLRHHKARTREIEHELAENAELQTAIRASMAHLLSHQRAHRDIAWSVLQGALVDLERDREMLLMIIAVLAPNEWRWRVREHWRVLK